MPHDIREEIVAAALLLPCAVGDLRAPVSREVSCTDASMFASGAVAAAVPQKLADELYRQTEQRGEHVRLDGKLSPFMSPTMVPPAEHVNRLCEHLSWRVVDEHNFKQSSHINLQEARALKRELVRRCAHTSPERIVNGVDSRV